VLSLIENGELTKLKNRWWYDRTECKHSDKQASIYIEYTLISGMFYGFHFSEILFNFLFLTLRSAEKKRRNTAALTFVKKNKATQNIIPLLLGQR
jgi:gamma-glutamylcysteine synthetase